MFDGRPLLPRRVRPLRVRQSAAGAVPDPPPLAPRRPDEQTRPDQRQRGPRPDGRRPPPRVRHPQRRRVEEHPGRHRHRRRDRQEPKERPPALRELRQLQLLQFAERLLGRRDRVVEPQVEVVRPLLRRDRLHLDRLRPPVRGRLLDAGPQAVEHRRLRLGRPRDHRVVLLQPPLRGVLRLLIEERVDDPLLLAVLLFEGGQRLLVPADGRRLPPRLLGDQFRPPLAGRRVRVRPQRREVEVNRLQPPPLPLAGVFEEPEQAVLFGVGLRLEPLGDLRLGRHAAGHRALDAVDQCNDVRSPRH